MGAPLSERFWPKVNVRGADDCWEWLAAKDGHGYGAIGEGRRTLQAHRVACELAGGPIPPGLHVLHSCDNPSCVNPRHLTLGTHKDNMADMGAKGRQAKGKLTERDVRAIRAANEDAREIAQQFGVTPSNVRQIKRGVAWGHVQ